MILYLIIFFKKFHQELLVPAIFLIIKIQTW